MPRPKVTSMRGRYPADRFVGEVMCEGCNWQSECTRERARIHARKPGHIVHFVIRDITTYYPPEKPDA